MKKTVFAILISLLYFSSFGQPTGLLTDINNHSVILDNLSSKKILVIILPLQIDTAMVNQLLRFQNKYKDSLQIIGLVCLSYCNTSASIIQSIYGKAIESGVVITEGSTVETPTTEREAMLKWLSERNKNNRQTEPGLTGSKYFLSKSGKMYAQLGHEASLDSRIIVNIAKTRLPGEN